MKHIFFILIAVSLMSITGCSEKESGVPPITQPIGTGSYEPIVSSTFCEPHFAVYQCIENYTEIYTTKEAFTQFYKLHPDAEQVDPSDYSIILTCGSKNSERRKVIGQEFYRVGENRYVLAIHTCPSNVYIWNTSALVPALPKGASVGILEVKHSSECEVSSVSGSYEVYGATEYPLPGRVKDEFRIIRTQEEYETYIESKTESNTIDFTKYSLVVGNNLNNARPERIKWRFVCTGSEEYILAADCYYNVASYDIVDWQYGALVPAVPINASINMLVTNYWINSFPLYMFLSHNMESENYTLPESFTISENNADSLFVIRTQEDFNNYFSSYNGATTVDFSKNILLIARGKTPNAIKSIKGGCSILDGNGYVYDVFIRTDESAKQDTWYHAIKAPLLPVDAPIWLAVDIETESL